MLFSYEVNENENLLREILLDKYENKNEYSRTKYESKLDALLGLSFHSLVAWLEVVLVERKGQEIDRFFKAIEARHEDKMNLLNKISNESICKDFCSQFNKEKLEESMIKYHELNIYTRESLLSEGILCDGLRRRLTDMYFFIFIRI